MNRNRTRSHGFTLIELLVVVAIIGILVAIAIANYLSAMTRAKQRRTMADMRVIAQAWEARAAEMQGYRAAGFTFPGISMSGISLQTMLVPTYTRTLPIKDGWSRPLDFAVDDGGGGKSDAYAIRSRGRDGEADGTTYVQGQTTDPDADIVFSNGQFVTHPAQAAQSNN